MKTVLVSIILPTYNGAKFIANSMESVTDQTFSDWELIIINDGSTDGTDKIVSSLAGKDGRIKYFKNDRNLGIQKTLNSGLRKARGEYIARVDDDDVWVDKDKLKKQVEFLENNQEYVLAGTGTIVVDEYDNEIARYFLPEKDGDIRKKILRKNCFTHSGVMFKKDTALKLGGYSEEKEALHIEDYDLWLRLGKVGKFANLPFYGIRFTLRSGTISSTNKIDQFRKDIELAKKYRNNYPNFWRALIFGYLRLYLYIFLRYIPFKCFKNIIFKVAKKI